MRSLLALLRPALLGLAASLLAFAQEPVNIGSRLELFVDDALVAGMKGAELRLHAPVKAPRPQSPLPEKHMMTVIKDGELYRAWYRSTDPDFKGVPHSGHEGETVNYAESRDGHEWTFPSLGLHEIAGNRDNNVILAKWSPYLTNFMPFLDTRAGVDPAERYKTLAGYPGPGNKVGKAKPGIGLYAFVSPDGIRWTKKEEAIPYRNEWRHAFDSPNITFWSEVEQLYVCYFRTWVEDGKVRSVSRATSPDFVTWSEPVELKPNLPGEHLYTTMTQPYFRAPHIYIATPTRYIPGRGDSPSYDKKDANATDILFMSSRAGSTRYDRPFTEAFIRPGLDPARWRNRANYVALNVHPTAPGEMSIYHRSGDRYVLRTDGFISVHTGAKSGELLTKPLVFSGRELLLNFSTGAAGSVQVEVLKAGGGPVPGFTLADCELTYGDAIERTIKWKGGDLQSLAGQAVQLRFVMQECDLYSYRFR